MITTALLLALLARPTAPFLESGAFDLDTPLLPPFVVAGEELPPAAARSLRALTDYLERHPEALIKGKELP